MVHISVQVQFHPSVTHISSDYFTSCNSGKRKERIPNIIKKIEFAPRPGVLVFFVAIVTHHVTFDEKGILSSIQKFPTVLLLSFAMTFPGRGTMVCG